MRLTGQVRRDEGLKTPLNANSTYKPVERAPRRFNTLKVPKKLQAALPYASKPKIMKPQHRQTYLEKRAVVMEPEEKRAVALLQQARALRRDQVQRRKAKQGDGGSLLCRSGIIWILDHDQGDGERGTGSSGWKGREGK